MKKVEMEIDLPEFLEADKAIKAKILKRSREAAVSAIEGYARMQAERWLKKNEGIVKEATQKAIEKYLVSNLEDLATKAVQEYGLFLSDVDRDDY